MTGGKSLILWLPWCFRRLNFVPLRFPLDVIVVFIAFSLCGPKAESCGTSVIHFLTERRSLPLKIAAVKGQNAQL